MTRLLISLLAFSVLIAAAAPGGEPPEGFDARRRPSEIETTHRYRCAGTETILSYRHVERFDVDASAEGRRSVLVLDLRVSGRSIAANDIRRLADMFGAFAWVESIRLRCQQGTVYLGVRAMHAAEWAASIGDRPRPSLRILQISVDPAGVVRASGAGA